MSSEHQAVLLEADVSEPSTAAAADPADELLVAVLTARVAGRLPENAEEEGCVALGADTIRALLSLAETLTRREVARRRAAVNGS